MHQQAAFPLDVLHAKTIALIHAVDVFSDRLVLAPPVGYCRARFTLIGH
jgi:hypothetical protein